MRDPERYDRLFDHDRSLWERGLVFAGIDEAGRGPLLGCVVAACLVMPRAPRVPGVFDSKALSERQREILYDRIMAVAQFAGVGRAEAEEIDRLNILQATRLAMRRAASGAPAALFLTDAVGGLGLHGEERPIVKGDATSYSIAAASIVAKVTRDRELRGLDARYPQYGLAHNKGYGTKEHLEALRAFGPCPEHRRSFIAGVLSR
jgi:ribonuclease HII